MSLSKLVATPPHTPSKSYMRLDLTPGSKAQNCIVCGKIHKKTQEKRNLIKDGKKSDILVKLETLVEDNTGSSLTNTVCIYCHGTIDTITRKWENLKTKYIKNKKLLSETHGKYSSKRMSRTPRKDGQKKTKKALFKDSDKENISNNQTNEETALHFTVKCQYPSGPRNIQLPVIYNGLVHSLTTCKEDNINKAINAIPTLRKALERTVCVTINKEIEEYCKKETPSILRTKGKDTDLKEFSFDKLEKELEAKTPLFWKITKAATFNTSHNRNKTKTTENIIPVTLTAAAKLINIHCEEMNVYKQMLSIILKKNGLKKMGFVRLGKTYDAMSYEHVKSLQDEYADQFENTIMEWKGAMEDPTVHHPGYTIASDNVDWEVGRRHITVDNQKKSVHKINAVAYKNRVNNDYLPSDGPKGDITQVPLQELLPNANDTAQLTEHLVVLIGNLWAQYIDVLGWFKEHLPDHIAHDHEREMKQKTVKTQLGLFNYDQKQTDQVREFMQLLHERYVPNHANDGDAFEDDPPKRVMLQADYLGFDRQKSAQSQVQDARTPSKRLEGFVSVLSDFHAQAAWHKVCWEILFDTLTEREVGTLYHARQHTKSRNVTKDPHDDFYAAEDLLDKFTTAYLIAGGLDYFGLSSTSDTDVTMHAFDPINDSPADYVQSVVRGFIHDHILNPPPSLPGDNIHKCRFCRRVFKSQKVLDKHEKKHRDELAKATPDGCVKCDICGKLYKKASALEKHVNAHTPEELQPEDVNDDNQSDYVYNYTRRVMALCTLRMNFEDAIKRGDGDRLMLCYKLMYLYFKEGNCPKYAFGILETVCQAHYLLSEKQSQDLRWNRFVNNKGNPDSNMPVDLDVEHLNKPLKTDLNTFRGEITDKSVQRISRSVEETEKIMKNFDLQLKVKKPSGKHEPGKFESDSKDLASTLHEKKVFRRINGREHLHIRKVSADPLADLDMKDIHSWLKKCVRNFSDKHFYKC